jgi:hypothetical protein
VRKKVPVFIMALLIASGLCFAQERGGVHEQVSSKGSLMHANMGVLADITAKMYQILNRGRMSSEQDQQALGILKRMSQMMQEMSVPHGEDVKKRHKAELHKMHEEVNTLYSKVVH